MALEWTVLHKLGVASTDVWSSCEETRICLEGGLLKVTGTGNISAAEELLTWLMEAGHDKAVPSARTGAFRLLSAAIGQCPPAVLSSSLDKLCQLLRSGMSATSSSPCRVFACQAAAALVEKAWGVTEGGGDQLALCQQVQQDALPRLMTSFLACAANNEQQDGDTVAADPMVRAAALSALAVCASVVGIGLKPHAAKMERLAYAALDVEAPTAPELQQAAISLLARIPLTLSDAAHWTTMLMALLGEAGKTLTQVWPEAPVPLSLKSQPQTTTTTTTANNSPATHIPAWTPLPSKPGKGGQAAFKAYALLARTRIQAAVNAAVALLSIGHHHGDSPVLLPSPALLGMAEALLSATPRGKSHLGSTPSALPATALQAMQPFLRSLGLDLLSAYLSAAGTSSLRYLARTSRVCLRALSLPVAQGCRAQAYTLFSQIILSAGPSAMAKLVEPALPLLTHHAGLFLHSKGSSFLANNTMAAAPVISSIPPKGPNAIKSSKGNKHSNNSSAVNGATSQKKNEVEEMEQEAVSEVERLGIAVFKALETVLLGCGSLLSRQSRLLVERAVGAGLNDLSRGVPRPSGAVMGVSWVRRNPSLRVAFLQVATHVLLVPHQDGSGSALLPLAARVFGSLVLDVSNEGVARAALLGRAVAESITHPRAAPVFIPAALLRLEEEEAVVASGGGGSAVGVGASASFPFQGERESTHTHGPPVLEGGSLLSVPPAATAAVQGMNTVQVAEVWATQKGASTTTTTTTSAAPTATAPVKEGGGKTKPEQQQQGQKRGAPSSSTNAGGATAASSSSEVANKRTKAAATQEKGKEKEKAAKKKAVEEEEEEEEDDEPLPAIVDDGGPDESDED